jgi:hypothetical protein
MGRTIRVATHTPRTPRRKKWMLRALTTGVLTAGSLAALAGPAQAYTGTTCAQELGSGNVFDVDPIKIDTARVDFGDLPYIAYRAGGGAPGASAVICWGNDGRVAIVGRLFYGPPQPGLEASVTLRGFNGLVGSPGWGGLWTVAGSSGTVTNREVHEVWGPELGRQPTRVNLQLALRTAPTGDSSTVLEDVDYFRGDNEV